MCVVQYVTGLVWFTIYIGVSVGGAVVLILTVAVAVCYCRGRSNTGMYSLEASTILKGTFQVVPV